MERGKLPTYKDNPKFWDEIAKKPLAQLLLMFSQLKNCHYSSCKTRFPKGILRKHPKQIVPLESMFSGEYLFHIKSTHGLDPDMFTNIIRSYKGEERHSL